MSFSNKANQIRKQLSRYTTKSVVSLLIARLHDKSPVQIEAQRMPWVTCLALDWALEVSPVDGAEAIDEKTLQRILNDIWGLQDSAAKLESGRGWWFGVRAMLIPQLRFQQNHLQHSFFLYRMYAVYNHEDASPALLADFKKITGVDFGKFMIFCVWLDFALTSANSNFISFETAIVRLSPHFTVSEIAVMLQVVGGSLLVIRDEIREYKDPDRALNREEYFEEPFLINRPLLILEDGLGIIHKDIFAIGVAESVLRLNKKNDYQRFKRHFTKAFESYVGSVLKTLSVTILTEHQLKEMCAESGVETKNPDFYLRENGYDLFIEVKGVEPKRKVLVSDSPRIIRDQISDYHLKGVEQVSEFIASALEHSLFTLQAYENRYAVIVTHQDFFIGDACNLTENLDSKHAEQFTELVKGKIPLENIHFCSILDLESITNICRDSNSSVCDFLRYCSSQQSDSATRKFEMGQHIQAYINEKSVSEGVQYSSDLVIDARKSLLVEVVAMARENEKFWSHGWQQTVPCLLDAVRYLKVALKQDGQVSASSQEHLK